MSPRFFSLIPLTDNPKEIFLDESETRHAVSVFRLKPGDLLDVFDGKGRRFSGVAGDVSGGRLCVRVGKISQADFPSRVSIVIAAGLFKMDRMEILVQKACELGAQALQPIHAERSVVKVGADRWGSKQSRWLKIIRESCKQCGLAYQPELLPLTRFSDILKSFESYDLVLMPTLECPTRSLGEVLSTENPRRILVMIGPEGDFSKREVDAAILAGAKPVSFGPLTLRSETAGIYALSVIHFYYREVRNDS